MRSLIVIALALTLAAVTARADDWPQYLGPKRDGVWRETGIVDTLPKEPKYLWRTPVGQGYAGPAVADGRVFVTDLIKEGDGGAAKGAELLANAVQRAGLRPGRVNPRPIAVVV